MSSVVDQLPLAWLATYAGCKAFVRQFSNCLREELDQDGDKTVRILVVSPFLVRTSMTRFTKHFWAVEPSEVVIDALSSLDSRSSQGPLRHKLFSLFSLFYLPYYKSTHKMNYKLF